MVNDKEIEMSKRVAVLAGIAILLALSVAPTYAQDVTKPDRNTPSYPVGGSISFRVWTERPRTL